MHHAKTAFITGTSAGIGQAAAAALTRAGYRVIGTSRRAEPGEIRDGIRTIRCDVTDDASVAAAVAEALEEFGRIDLLVNNAGIGISGVAEDSTIAQVKALYETNVFGVVRVTGAVLPIMRRQGSGRILNVGSVLGLIPGPFNAHYSGTKHAIEGYSESLDHEVRGFGIRVAVIEPGLTNTSFEGSTIPADAPLPDYAAIRDSYAATVAGAIASADTAEVVAQTIVEAATASAPKLRYPSGKSARQISFIRRFLPRAIFDRKLREAVGLS